MTNSVSSCFNTPEEEAQFNISRDLQRLEMAVQMAINATESRAKWLLHIHPDYIVVAVEDPECEGKELFGHHFEIHLRQEPDFKTCKMGKHFIEVNYPCLGEFNPLNEPLRCELLRAMASLCTDANVRYITCIFRDYSMSIRAYRDLTNKD